MWRWMTALAVVGVGSTSALACDTPSHVVELAYQLDNAEEAFAEFDSARFDEAMDAMPFLVPCLEDRLSPRLAAQFHRMQGLRHFGKGDEAATLASFGAARRADPDYSFPTSLVPEGNKIRALYHDAKPAPTEAVPAPRQGGLFFDGVFGPTRPTSTTLVQHMGPDGSIATSALLEAGDPLPDYPHVPRTRNRLLGVSIATAVLAAGLDVGAISTKRTFDAWRPAPGTSPQKARDEATAYQSRVSTLSMLAGVSLGVSVAAGGAAFVVDR